MSRIVFIIGSPREGSRLFGLTDYLEERLALAGYSVAIVSATELPAEELLRADFSHPAIQTAVGLIEEADAIVIASPIYKGTYSGALKTILDLIPQKGFADKPVLPLFIGQSVMHLLAVDYALKSVVAALGGTRILGGVFSVDQWVGRLEDGGFKLTEKLKERLDDAFAELVAELGGYAPRSTLTH